MKEFYTLEEAKQYLRENWEKGVDCPCCTRAVKLYHYTINSGQAYATILLYRLTKQLQPEDGWIHVSNEFANIKVNAHTLSYHRAALWGLIEKMPTNDDPKKRTSGYWRITEKGKQFVEGNLKVRGEVYVFEGKIIKAGGAEVDIRDALQEKFDYEELMK